MRTFFLALYFVLLAGCGENSDWSPPISMNVSALPARFAGRNPVAVIRGEGLDGTGSCSGAFVEERYVLTAGHCLFTNGVRLNPAQLRVYFRNSGDAEPTAYLIDSIPVAQGSGTDWALLRMRNPTAILARHGSLELSRAAYVQEGILGTEGEALVYDPLGNGTFTLQRKTADFWLTARGLSAFMDTRRGNSGSPILIGNRVVGVVSQGNTIATLGTYLYPLLSRVP